MEKKALYTLLINREFKNLIRPLRRQEYLKLELSLKSEGCKEPLRVWNGFIVDGHNRYEICHKHNIPFAFETMDFEYKEEVLSWICASQLKRKTITEETRKFLIGMEYETSKYVNQLRYPKRSNQYIARMRATEGDDESCKVFSSRRTASVIAKENNVSYATVEKYAAYTRALEAIGNKTPELVPKILSGSMRLSHNALLEMASLTVEELERINSRAARTHSPYLQFARARTEEDATDASATSASSSVYGIKDMPAYDPDATITELALTVPTWINSIKRTQKHTNYELATEKAKKRLESSLTALVKAAQDLLAKIERGDVENG